MEEYVNTIIVLCYVRDYIIDLIPLSRVLVTYHMHFKCSVLEIGSLSLQPKSNRERSCYKDTGDADSQQRSAVDMWLSHSASLYFEIQS